MQNWRSSTKWIAGAGAVAALSLVLLFYTASGLALVGRLVRPLSGGAITVKDLSGVFPGRLRVAGLEIADAQGTWLRATDVSLNWSSLSLLRNHVAVQHVAAKNVIVLRRPIPSGETGGKTPRIDVERFDFVRIEIARPVIGRAAVLTASGTLHFVSRHQLAADIIASRRGNNDAYRIAGGIENDIAHGRIAIQEGPDGILGALVGLPGLGPVNLSARAGGDSTANGLDFTLSAGLLHANAKGTIQLAAQRADMDVSATAPAMTLRPGIGWQSLSASGHFHGSFSAPQIQAQLALKDAAFDGLKAAQIAMDISGQQGNASLRATAAGIMLPGQTADLFAHAPVIVNASADLKAPMRPVIFTVSHPLANLQGRATTRGATSVTAELILPSLGPLAASHSIDMSGTAAMRIAASLAGTKTRIALQGKIDAQGAAMPARLLGRNAQFDFTTSLENSDILESQLRLRGAGIAAEINGTARKGVLGFRLALDLTDLSRLSGMLQGSLALRGSAAGPMKTARMSAHGTAQVATKGFARQQVAIDLEASGLPTPQSARLTMNGHLDGAPLILRATLGAAHRLDLMGRWRSLDATGDVALPEKGPVTGKLRIAAKQLADIAVFTGSQITGAADAAIILMANRGGTDAKLTANVHGLQLGQIRAENIAAQGTATDILGKPTLGLAVTAHGINAQAFTGEAVLHLDGPQNRLAAHLSADLKDGDGGPAHLAADALLDAPTHKVALRSLSGTWRGTALTLRAPALFDYAGGLSVDRLTARLGNGEITASGRVLPVLAFTASARNIALDSFKSFLPRTAAQGTLSGTAALSGALAAPQGTLTLEGVGLRAAFSSSAVPPATARIRALLQGGRAALTARLDAGSTTSLDISGEAGLAADAAMNLHIKGNADLALLDPVLTAGGRRLRGKLIFETQLSGSRAAPRITGSGNLSDGEIQDYLRGLQVQGIAATFAAQGAVLRVTRFQARAGNGTLSGSGSIDLGAPGLPVSLVLTARNARPIVSDLFTATLSGDLKLTGAWNRQTTLSGDLEVTGGEINLPDRFPADVAVLNVRRRGRPVAPEPVVRPLGLDVTIRTTGALFVRGHDIDAEMQGRIRVGGDTAAPLVSGGFNMTRGSYRVAGQVLDFTSGRIGFDGAGLRERLDPTINFVAQTVSGGITAVLTITGYASAPKIVLSSTPQLPQDEVVSHLLFKQSVKQLSPFQLASIAQALISMGGVGGGFNPLSMVRRNLGLDRLTVGSTDAGTSGEKNRTTVEAGRYVSRNVYVGVKQTLSAGTQTQVQVDITRRLKAQATVSTVNDATTTKGSTEDTGSSVGLAYQFEY